MRRRFLALEKHTPPPAHTHHPTPSLKELNERGDGLVSEQEFVDHFLSSFGRYVDNSGDGAVFDFYCGQVTRGGLWGALS